MIPAAGFNPHKSSPSTADFVRNLIVITFISLVFSANAIGQNIISTFAGTSWTFPSSVKTALSAPLGTIAGVATDPQGNVYAADTGNNLVFRIGTDGSIKIVAGNGTPGFSGDGGPATSASLYEPSALTLDPAGNLYIADAGNNRIRQVTPAGIISTFAGNGTAVAGTEVTQPKSVAIIGPTGLASDSAGNIYIADTGGHRIRKVTAAGVQSTIAGTGTAGFSGDAGTATSAALSGPTDVVVDSTGNIYIADNGNYRIRKINAGGIISTIAGTAYFYPYLNDGGSATSTTLFDPIAIALDSFGNLYIADQAIDRIRKVTSAGVISSVAGNLTTGFSGDGGSGLSASLNAPDSLAVDPAGNLIIADSGNERIRSLSTLGVITTIAGSGNFQYSGDGGPGISANLNFPESVAVDSGGNVFVADNLNNRIRKISPAGTITTVAGTGIPGYSGDNGLALSAALLHPASITYTSNTPLVCQVNGVSLTLLAAGTCSVTAAQPGNSSYAPAISVTQTFTVNPGTGGPAISANGIAPVYSTATTIQPGSWISIYGTNLATSTVSWNGDFPTTLGGTTVTINGKKAYLWFVSPAQINLQAPDDTTIGTVPVVVTTAAGTYVSSVKLAPTAPSFSLLDGKHVTGIILRQDGSGTYGGGTYDILGPTGSSLGYKTTAAKAGDSVVLFAVGLGPTTPPVPAGQAFTSAAPTASSVQIVVNAMLITPAFSGLTSAGLYQLNITIPPGLPTGDVPLAALTGGLQTQSGVVISLQ